MSRPPRCRACGAVTNHGSSSVSPRANLLLDAIYTDQSPCAEGVSGVDEGCGWAGYTGVHPIVRKGTMKEPGELLGEWPTGDPDCRCANNPTASLIDLTGAAAWSGRSMAWIAPETHRDLEDAYLVRGNAGSTPASAQPHPSQPPASGAPRSSEGFPCHTPLGCHPSSPESRQGD